MAKTKKKTAGNERCPFNDECGQQCTVKGFERNCGYYAVNAHPGAEIADQAAITSREALRAMEDQLMEETRPMIEYISVDELHPHPDNPRKELGDLTELCESIKARGIMQNLTVLWAGPGKGYTVLIGHRRLAAAKLAELDELPCVVIDGISRADQVAIMTMENLQRADLTLSEQAEAVQLMMNLGLGIAEIADKTGLSKSTVRRRSEMAKLNKVTFADVTRARQVTMDDMDALFKIKNEKRRDEVLKYIGTADFKSKLDLALDTEAAEKLTAALDAKLTAQGGVRVKKDKDLDGKEYGRTESVYSESNEKRIMDSLAAKKERLGIAEGDEFGFSIKNSYSHYVTVRIAEKYDPDKVTAKEAEDHEKAQKQIEKAKRVNAIKAALDEAQKKASEMRTSFVLGLSERACAAHMAELVAWFVSADGRISREAREEKICQVILGRALTDEEGGDEELYEKTITEFSRENPHKLMLLVLFFSHDAVFNTWEYSTGEFDGVDSYYPERERELYERLCGFGYEVSTFERGLYEGTSELYVKGEKA